MDLTFTPIWPNQNSYTWVKHFSFIKVHIKPQIIEILRKLKGISFTLPHLNTSFQSVLGRAKKKKKLIT